MEVYKAYDEMFGPLFRTPSCNGCDYLKLRHELGIKFLSIYEGGGVGVYEQDAEPIKGQGSRVWHKGKPVRFRVWFMSIGHSDECYNWKPPEEEPCGKRT